MLLETSCIPSLRNPMVRSDCKLRVWKLNRNSHIIHYTIYCVSFCFVMVPKSRSVGRLAIFCERTAIVTVLYCPSSAQSSWNLNQLHGGKNVRTSGSFLNRGATEKTKEKQLHTSIFLQLVEAPRKGRSGPGPSRMALKIAAHITQAKASTTNKKCYNPPVMLKPD